jgi:hypothetical protein
MVNSVHPLDGAERRLPFQCRIFVAPAVVIRHLGPAKMKFSIRMESMRYATERDL